MTPNSSKVLKRDEDKAGYRAAEAYIRPTPVTVHGNVVSYGFDLRVCAFSLSLTAPSATSENAPTEIFLPEWHFPNGNTSVEVSGGKWSISLEDELQKLRWWHAEGDQKITVKGVVRKSGVALSNVEEEEGYLEQCQKAACSIM
jgi:hypothetical protein